ncbi:hypothetical protein DRO57_09020 [Candidatus Bathyarchaeota archaeon]|nr:MAG: hypothetical protein DRO57_09020 [Candidatus Bathyarchaeota archaeon]
MDDDVYEKLVKESLKRYGTVRAISRVLNELLRESLKDRENLIRLIYSEKIARTTAEEFESFRRELSKRLER